MVWRASCRLSVPMETQLYVRSQRSSTEWLLQTTRISNCVSLTMHSLRRGHGSARICKERCNVRRIGFATFTSCRSEVMSNTSGKMGSGWG